ncbi:MAG: polyprenyl synthetase family protein [Acidobacteriota bacterium]
MGSRARLHSVAQNQEFERLSAAIHEMVGPKLLQVEKTVAEKLKSPYVPVADMGAYLAASRGKRLRPILLLLFSRALGYEGRQDSPYASVFEFIHTATLVHDDIVDQAIIRRGRASLNSQWGPEMSVLMGDYVFINAMHMAVEEGASPILPLISRTTLKLIEGELIQSHRKWDLTISQEENKEIICCKTAHLFAACAKTPGYLVEGEEPVIQALEAYGLNLGIAFQLVDDCLDFVSDELTLGKPVGQDLKEGKITLPLILLMEEGTPQDRAFIEAVVASRRFEPDTLQGVVARVVDSGMVSKVEEIAGEYALEARDALSILPPSRARELLERVPDFVLKRTF